MRKTILILLFCILLSSFVFATDVEVDFRYLKIEWSSAGTQIGIAEIDIYDINNNEVPYIAFPYTINSSAPYPCYLGPNNCLNNSEYPTSDNGYIQDSGATGANVVGLILDLGDTKSFAYVEQFLCQYASDAWSPDFLRLSGSDDEIAWINLTEYGNPSSSTVLPYSTKTSCWVWNMTDLNSQTPPLDVNLIYPTDLGHYNEQIDFIYTSVSDSINSCSLWGNFSGIWGINQTNTTAVDITGNNNTFIMPTLPDGSYIWNINCISDFVSSWATANYTFTIDTVRPDITINPNNFFTSANDTTINQYTLDNITLNITVEDSLSLLFGFEVNITDNTGAVKYAFRNDSIGLYSYNFYNQVNTSTWATGYYTIDVWASDTHTAKEINDYNIIKRPDELVFNTAEGNTISIKSTAASSTDAIKSSDRYSFDFTYSQNINKETYIITSDNPIEHIKGSGYNGHLVIYNPITKQGNWLDFESPYTREVEIEKISNFEYEVTVFFYNNIKDVKFNSIGGLNINHKTYNWYKGELTETNEAALSGSLFHLYANLTTSASISDIEASIIYNGTSYPITKTLGADYIVFSTELSKNVTVDTSFDYAWNFTVTTSGATIYNFTSSGSHTVSTFYIGKCGVYPTITATFNLYDENIPSNDLNGTLEIDGEYWFNPADEIKTFNLNYSSNSTFNLCIGPANATLYSTMYLKYTVPSSFTHRYYIINQNFSNNTKTFSLYNFNETTGVSDLKITVRRVDNYQYMPAVIAKLQRRYISEGVWRTVQMDKSGDYGLLFYNIIEETEDYRLIFMDTSNNILKTTNSLKFVCSAGLCELVQQLNPYSDNIASITPAYTISFNNDTEMLNISWVVTSGDSVTIRDILTKETVTGPITICDDSATGSQGSLLCNTTGYTGTLYLRVLQDGKNKIAQFIDKIGVKLFSNMSVSEQAIWTFFIMVAIIMFGLFSPVGVIIATILGLIAIFYMGIFSGITLTFIIVATVLGVAISIKIKT